MKKRLSAVLVAFLFAIASSSLFAQAKPADAKVPTKADAKKAVKAAAAPAASDAEIAAAQQAGKVWVNTGTKVYHKGGRFYGKTKEGKFMTEDEAKKAGFTAAKSEIGEKKK